MIGLELGAFVGAAEGLEVGNSVVAPEPIGLLVTVPIGLPVTVEACGGTKTWC